MALVLALIFSVLEIAEGHLHGADLAEKQPAKLAAMEAHWETGIYAPKYLFAWPDQQMEKNTIEILPIPGVLSLLAKHSFSAEVKGLKDFPKEDRPPVFITYMAFNLMVGLGFYFVLATILGWIKRNRLMESRWYLRMMLYSIPLTSICCELGWTVSEIGRQPWIVYGVMKTADAFSPIAVSQVLTSLVAFILVYGLLGAIGFYLIIKNAKQGPDPA